MGISENKKNTIASALLSGFLSVAVFLSALFLSGMLPGQRFYFLHGDGYSQVIPFVKMFFRQLSSGGSLLYSFETGLGMPTVAIYAYYVLSPFNIPALFIEDVEVASVFIICLKVMCISMCQCVMLKKTFKLSSGTAVIFSLAYSLCSFLGSFYLSFIFLDMMYILPLIVMAMHHFFKTGKWGWLCVIYTYSFIVQFYCAYMTGIFSAVLFVAYAWYSYRKTWSLWAVSVKRYLLCVLIAALLAAPLLIPAGYELFSFYASDALKLDEFSLNPISFVYGFYPGYMGQMQGTNNTAPLMYAGIPSAVLCIVFFCDKKHGIRKKILAAIPLVYLTLSSFISPLYLFMHAFDAPNFYAFRFSWMVSFTITVIAAFEFEKLKKEKLAGRLPVLLACGGYVLVYILILLVEKGLNLPESGTVSLTKGGLIIGATVLYAILLTGKLSERIIDISIGAILSVELFVGVLAGQGVVQDSLVDRGIFQLSDQCAREGMRLVKESEVDSSGDFYRVRYVNPVADNVSMIYGYRGLGWFSSIENENIRRVLKEYGYGTKDLVALDCGSSAFMRMILSQKYNVGLDYFDSDNDPDTVLVFSKNERTLPLGFMVSDDILGYETKATNPFDAVNGLASVMCGSEHSIYKLHGGQCGIDTENAELIQYENGTSVRKTGEEGRVTYSIVPEQNGNIYAYMSRWGITSYTKSAPLLYSQNDIGVLSNYSRVCMPHIISVEPEQDGTARLFLYMQQGSVFEFEYENLCFAYEDESELDRVYDELQSSHLELKSFRDDRIEAHVSVGADKKVLFTSIPYDEGWKIYVDGVKADTKAVLDGAFLAVELTEGEHELLFSYRQKWILPGIACLVAGAMIIIVCVVLEMKAEKKQDIG